MRNWPALDVARSSPVASWELFQAALTDYDVAAIDDTSDDPWRVFFHAAHERDRAAAALRREFPSLTLTPVEVADEDWAARSQANLHFVRVGSLVVAPPWDIPPVLDSARVVVIQPSMGFGTGHHATTRLCLAALQSRDLHGISVLDIGTGSGVLAIAASLLGAAPVLAIDDDPDAVASARENLTLNPGAHVTFEVCDLKGAVLTPAPAVVANLTGGLLVQAAPRVAGVVADRGMLIISGLTQAEEADVRAAYGEFDVLDRGQEDEWICMTLQRRGTFA